MANLSGYNFAYLDEQTKRMISPRHLKSGGDPRLSGAVWRARDADAVRLGNRRHLAYRQRDWRKRRAEGD